MEPEEFSQDPVEQDTTPDFQGNSEPEAAGNQPSEDEFSGHPAWKPFEETLGPIHYRSIEPHLRSMNQAFEAKIAATNKSLEPWKGFTESGVDPDQLRFAQQVVERINSDPKAMYQQLGEYLKQNGLLEEAAQVEQQAKDEGLDLNEDTEEDPRYKQLQDELQQLKSSQQQMLESRQAEIQQQQREAAIEKETNNLRTEVEQLKTQGYDDFAIKQILDAAELNIARTGQPKPLAEVAKQFDSLRQTILQQPRPQAPRLPSGGGQAPANAPTDLSRASRKESVDTLAALISGERG